MVKVSAYASKLQNPLWQRKRLTIFNRDNFKCTCCRSTVKQLEVHHLEYFGNLEPWEYPDDLLVTLCFECHRGENNRGVLESNLATAFRVKGFLSSDLSALSCILHSQQRFTDRLLKILRNYE